MRGAVLGPHVLVVFAPGVGVPHADEDGRTQRLAIEDAGEDLRFVRLLALGCNAALSGLAPVELLLNLLDADFEQRRAAVDDDADRVAVRLSPCRDSECVSERVSHICGCILSVKARRMCGIRWRERWAMTAHACATTPERRAGFFCPCMLPP